MTGNEHDYLRLSLKDGRVSLAVQLGSGSPFDTSIRPAPASADSAEAAAEGRKKNGVRFDDNEWHHVRVERRSSEVRSGIDWGDSSRYRARELLLYKYDLIINSLFFTCFIDLKLIMIYNSFR